MEHRRPDYPEPERNAERGRRRRQLPRVQSRYGVQLGECPSLGHDRRHPRSEWGDLEASQNRALRPSLFEEASLSGSVKIYEFRIDDRTGIKHQGLPPALQSGGA
ncbi:hypothetical protein ACLI4U_04750 [Natrialbaceae archaeon A-CW2]